MKRGFDAPKTGAGSKVGDYSLLLLKDKEEAIVRILDVPVQFRQHYGDGGSPTICPKEELGTCPICDDPGAPEKRRKTSFQFAVPVCLIGIKFQGQEWEALGEVRIFKQGIPTLRDLTALIKDWDYKVTDFKIWREGSGQTDTKYHIVPQPNPKTLPKGLEVPDIEALFMAEMEATAGGKTLAQQAEGDAAAPAEEEVQDFGDPFADQ